MNKIQIYPILTTIAVTVILTLLATTYYPAADRDLTSPATAVALEEEHHDEGATVELTPAELAEFDIQLGTTQLGILDTYRDLPGEIEINPDKLAHIVPRFPGTVKVVHKQVGDPVGTNDLLAVIESNESLTRYEMRSSMEGTVIEMHLSVGEVVSGADHGVVVANLKQVWGILHVYQRDLDYVREGQTVQIKTGTGSTSLYATVSYISPVVDKATRTADARVVLNNSDGSWRPGLFITGRIVIPSNKSYIIVPKTALQVVEDEKVVFIKTAEGFTPQRVELGNSDDVNVEILNGLSLGQTFVTEGGFTLKAELQKESFGGGHGH